MLAAHRRRRVDGAPRRAEPGRSSGTDRAVVAGAAPATPEPIASVGL